MSDSTVNILSTGVTSVISLGVDAFADELESQGVAVARVDWRPPSDVAADAYRLLPDVEA